MNNRHFLLTEDTGHPIGIVPTIKLTADSMEFRFWRNRVELATREHFDEHLDIDTENLPDIFADRPEQGYWTVELMDEEGDIREIRIYAIALY